MAGTSTENMQYNSQKCESYEIKTGDHVKEIKWIYTDMIKSLHFNLESGDTFGFDNIN